MRAIKIIIPILGFGERFRRAGYLVPKPLVKVEGKPIIAHVIDIFPGESDFLFICNQECSGRSNTDPPCRFNIDPGRIVAFALSNCG